MKFEYQNEIQSSQKDIQKITKLAVFDFDSTIFKSPLPSTELWTSSFLGTIISDCQWFCDSRTLSPPFIPLIPDQFWWNLEMLEKAKESIQKSDTLTVLLTGRRKEIFHSRIVELCQNAGLNFELYFLKEFQSSCTTIDFKFGVLESLLLKFVNIKTIELFDDRQKHVAMFANLFEQMKQLGRIQGYNAMLVKIPEFEYASMPPDLERELVLDLVQICNNRIASYRKLKSIESIDSLCNDRTPRRISISKFRKEIILTDHVYFTGIFLSKESLELIDSLFTCPVGWKKKVQHMTVSFGKQNDTMVEQLGGIGSVIALKATHIGRIPDKVVALKIDPIGLVSENEIMHITLFISPQGASKLSNSITDWELLENPLSLNGTLKTVTKIGQKYEIKPQAQKKDISIGELVKKRFPSLIGKETGTVVKFVNDWMEKSFIENLESNRALIEWKIQTLDLNQVIHPTGQEQ